MAFFGILPYSSINICILKYSFEQVQEGPKRE